ncbi:MAG: AAA family ATPase, partial [Candidatus Bathyarchaeia archaeon]
MIVLKRLKLKNFLSHENTELDFPLGVTAIVGPNGAGKTAIMDAVIHAFLGFEKDVKTRGENVDDLIRRGANEAEIALVFEANNREYLVQWTRTRGGRVDASLRRSDLGYIARSAKQVRQEVLKLLELDSKTLLNSIFIRQGEITSLVEAMPAERKKLIGRMIGIDAFERAWENMREIINHVEKLKSDIEKEVRDRSARLEEKKRNYDECVKTVEELKREIGVLKEGVEKLEKEYELISGEKQSLDEKEQIYNNLKKEYDIVHRDLSNVEERLVEIVKELEECKKAREEVEKLEPEIGNVNLLEGYVKVVRDLQEYGREEGDLRDKLILMDEAEGWIKESLRKITEFNYASKTGTDLASVDLPDDPIALNSRAAKAVSDVENLATELKAKEDELSNLLKKAGRLLPKPSKQVLNEKLAEFEEKNRKIEESIKEKDGEIGWIDGRINKLTQDFNSLDKFDICPLCRTRLTPQHREQAKREILEELDSLKSRRTYAVEERRKLEILREDVRRSIDALLKLSADVDNIEKLSRELETGRRSLAEKTREVNVILRKIDKLRGEIGERLSKVEEALVQIQREADALIRGLGYKPRDPEGELKALRSKKERFDRLKPIADKYEEKAKTFEENVSRKLKLEEEGKRLEESINNLGYDSKRHEEVKRVFDSLQKELVKCRAKLENLEAQLNDEERKRASFEVEIKRLESEISYLKAKCDKIEGFKSKLEKIRGAFSKDGVQRMLRQRLTPYISELATRYVERFNLDVTGITVDEDLEVTVMRGGETTPLSLLSGGEKVAIAIALRLAIAKALAGMLSTIIMDEPTIHLDEERRRELVEVVKSFFREGAVVPQMVIITH